LYRPWFPINTTGRFVTLAVFLCLVTVLVVSPQQALLFFVGYLCFKIPHELQNPYRKITIKNNLIILQSTFTSASYKGKIIFSRDEKKVGQTLPFRQVNLWAEVQGEGWIKNIPLLHIRSFGADVQMFDALIHEASCIQDSLLTLQ